VVKPGTSSRIEIFGATFDSLSSLEKERYDVDYGVKVTDLTNGLFKDMGIKKGYIILSINGKKVRNSSDVRVAAGNEKDIRSIEGIQSNGTVFSYSFGKH
jgi:S1-C subfamily serine protease